MYLNWILIAFITTIFSSIGTIAFKFIDNSEFDNVLFMLFTFFYMGIIGFIYFLFLLNKNNKNNKNNNNNNNKKFYIYTLLFAILHVFTILIAQYSFSITPNISYTHLIINLNIIFTIMASYYLFKQKLNIKSLFGLFLCLIGLLIIILNH